MRTLSVVTKLTVEARWSGVSAARGLPQSSIPPDAAAPRPATVRSRVLLPVPLRPIRAVSDPGGTEAETSRSRMRWP